MKKKKSLKILLAIAISLILLVGIGYGFRRNNYIYLTQFGNTTSTQMMGYGIKTRNNKNILIDGGTQEDTEQLEKYIMENGGEVEAWFITHPHIDHAGAFEIISRNENIKINKIYMSINDEQWYLENEPSREKDVLEFFKAIDNKSIQEKIKEPNINDTMKIDNVKIKILGIKNPEITINAINNSSMVMKMQVNNKKILFLGDTGAKSSEKLIKNQRNNLKADIVQMAHHGQQGATKELYEMVRPEICLWPTPHWLWRNDNNGTEDSGPWKTKETRKWMEDLGVKQNYIEKDGTHSIKIF